MTDDPRPEPPTRGIPIERIRPLHVPMLRVVEVGLTCWLVALIVILVVPALHEGDRGWWPWACVAGIALGSVGWAYLRRGRGNAHDAA
ncbi:DUF2530 domain-containing protein [Humibacillus xanthopallidus]|uniref:DUF2530 domain-containing protein n=1 Tax=Humibacillus xanthopallidus TaxID=412689 RepID=UPI00384AC636